MSVGPVIFLVLFALATSVGLLIEGRRRDQQIKRSLQRMATTRVCDVADGAVVKIVGKLEYAQKTCEAPLSGRSCAFFSVLIDKGGRNGPLDLAPVEGGVDFLFATRQGPSG
jgi:hypothetical protein